MPHEPGHGEEHSEEHRALLPEDAPTWQIDVAEGCGVYTEDGDEIGTIKEIRGAYFKVDAPMKFDFWLQRQFVTDNDDGRIRMSFKKDDLDNYKVKDLPDEAVYQGQDTDFSDRKGDGVGFETEYVGGPVNDPAEGPGTNAASSTIRAAESPSRGEVAP